MKRPAIAARRETARSLVENGEITWRRNTFPTADAASGQGQSEEGQEKDGDASIAPPKVALGKIEPAAMDDALRPALTALLPGFARCHAKGFAGRKANGLPAASGMMAGFVIDRLGDPWLVNGVMLEDPSRSTATVGRRARADEPALHAVRPRRRPSLRSR